MALYRRLCLSILLLATCQAAEPANYIFHQMYTGTFWNPSLNGWGWSVDIQRGVLFSAVYGYDESGGEAFLTLISNKVPSADPLAFSGGVFRTTQSGGSTEQVGSFSINLFSVGGQPGFVLTMDSPFITLDGFPLQRFGFLDSDELSQFAGTFWSVAAGTFGIGGTLNEGLGLFFFDDVRIEVPGTGGLQGLEVITDDPNATGFIYYDPDDLKYRIVTQDQVTGLGGILRADVASHNQMVGYQNAFALDTQGNVTSTGTFEASVLFIEEFSAKAMQARRRARLTPELAADLYELGRSLDLPPSVPSFRGHYTLGE